MNLRRRLSLLALFQLAAVYSAAPVLAQAFETAPLIEAAARVEIQQLRALWTINPAISFPETGPIESLPGAGLSLGLSSLASYLGGVGVDQRLDVLRWIVAHEAWHQVQFVRLRGVIPVHGSPERKLLECEADMVAAVRVVRARGATIDRNWSGLAALLRVARQIAQESRGAADYPTAAQRRSSIDLGIKRGLLDQITRLDPTTEGLFLQGQLRRIVDHRDQESEAEWASRQCGRILHFGAAGSGLIQGQPLFQWDRNPDHPFVRFAVPYKNMGQVPLSVSIEIRTVSVLKSAPDDHETWLTTDVSNQNFEVAPQGTYFATGQLQWYGDADRHPKVIFPLNLHSLVSVQTLPERVVTPARPLIPTGLSPSALALGAALERVAGSAQGRFVEIQSTTCEASSGTNYCSSLIPIPGATDTEIEIEADGATRFVALFCNNCTQADAVAAFDRVTSILRALYPFKNFQDRTTERSVTTEFRIRPSVSLTLTRYRRRDESYSVRVEIGYRFAFE